MGKIGILGGTFDPIHNGHLYLGRLAFEEYKLDEIWFMPSGHPPHKKDHRVTNLKHRCAMTRLAIDEYPRFIFFDFEVKRSGNTYTAQTMELLCREYPEHTFFFIIGADSLFEIEQWYEPDRVMEMADLLVAGRDYEDATKSMDQQIAYLMNKYNARIHALHGIEVDISSAELREMMRKGKAVVKYIPKPVLDYIFSNYLYQSQLE